MVEREEDRQRITPTTTVPEKYLETELAEELRKQRDLLDDVVDAVDDDDLAPARRRTPRGRRGPCSRSSTSAGRPSAPKEVGGSHVVELPVALFSSVKPFEEVILFTLGEHGEFESVSELAHELASELGEEYTDSFRSKVIYNVDRLGPGGRGYIEQEEHGKSYRTRLSRIGELWSAPTRRRGRRAFGLRSRFVAASA